MLLEGGFQPVLVSDVTSTGRRSDQYWLILLTRTTSISDQYWLLFRSPEGVLIACMCALLLPALQMEMPRGDTQTIVRFQISRASVYERIVVRIRDEWSFESEAYSPPSTDLSSMLSTL